ncbi:MAG TPA: NAD-dependent epimerase/dehydratase family protein [Balneolales bacterium]|nr:NAD-dependent epimerase/dehydratase family protein [Balneolales bacterium]
MDVFITGATGYIGLAVSKALRRAGHDVFGLTRSKEKATLLEANEVHPVTGSMQEPESYMKVAESCGVLIHAAVDYQNDTVDLDKQTVQTMLKLGEIGATPKTFIYTSGCWVVGSTGRKAADETTPLNPAPTVAWRPEVEQTVLQSASVKGLVIRPGCVYGERGGLTGMWFNGAENGGLSVVGDGSNRWTMIHVDDLADAYVRVAESGLSGEIFNISDRSRYTVKEMAEAVIRAVSYKGNIKYQPLDDAVKQMGPIAEALALDQHIDARKAVRLLGWEPKFGGFVDDAETFYHAWKAANGS